jgi:hypothetical protein
MTPEAQNPKVHHMTAKGARTALAHHLISQDSYQAVLRGELSLVDAKSLERNKGPGTSESQEVQGMSPESSLCLCGCGQRPKSPLSRFVQGHDHRLYGELKRNLEKDPLLRNERFSDSQRRYAVERGLGGPEVLPEEERDV